jgi:hypothetical protein
MAALTADRDTPYRDGGILEIGVAAATVIFAGSLVAGNAAGFATKGATALGLVGLGRADARADNSAGAAGDINVRIRKGVFRFANSASTDAITRGEIGDVAYIVDDQTVAKTDGTGTRSPAGTVFDVDAQGVWIKF